MIIGLEAGIIMKVIIIVLLVVIYVFRDRISYLFARSNLDIGKKINFYFRWIIDSCHISYKNWFSSIVLPILLMGIYWCYIILNKVSIIKVDSGLLNIFDTAILSPLLEEIIFRGIFLGLIILLISGIIYYNHRLKRNGFYDFLVYAISIGIISIIFSLFHAAQLDLRYVTGIIFGIVYILDKKNLLPAIIAHALNNLIILFLFAN